MKVISIHLMFWLDYFLTLLNNFCYNYFNTSYVLVGRYQDQFHLDILHISIHLMFWLDARQRRKHEKSFKISIHLMFWLDNFYFIRINILQYFNTSYVLVGRISYQYRDELKRNFNTSYVLVGHINTQPYHSVIGVFQYILCFGWTCITYLPILYNAHISIHLMFWLDF